MGHQTEANTLASEMEDWAKDADDHGKHFAPVSPATLRRAAILLRGSHDVVSLLKLIADIRAACGDNGKRMQDELVQFIRDLKKKADGEPVHTIYGVLPANASGMSALDTAVRNELRFRARQAGEGSGT